MALTAVFHYYLVKPCCRCFTSSCTSEQCVYCSCGLYWVQNITDEAVGRIEVRLSAARQASTHSLVALGRRVWKVLVALILFLIVLKSFGFDVNSALAVSG